jgi:hypothetical protein
MAWILLLAFIEMAGYGSMACIGLGWGVNGLRCVYNALLHTSLSAGRHLQVLISMSNAFSQKVGLFCRDTYHFDLMEEGDLVEVARDIDLSFPC